MKFPDRFKITESFLNQYKTAKGGWSAIQLGALGVKWPLVKGWKESLIGKEITHTQACKFIELSTYKPYKKKMKKRARKLREKEELSKLPIEKEQQSHLNEIMGDKNG